MDTRDHENITDEDIPKKLKVVIEEGLTLLMCEDNKKLRGFLAGGLDTPRQHCELILLTMTQLTFELLRHMKSSYYLSCSADRLALACNLKPAAVQVDGFQLETDFSYQLRSPNCPSLLTRWK